MAFHYDLSDRRDKALPYLIQAAQRAADIFALEIASGYLERAIALMDELGIDDPARRWPILEQLGTWAKVLADTSRAVASYEQALALRPTGEWQPGPSDRVRLHRSAARTFIAAGRMAKAEQHLQTAVEIVAGVEQASLDYANMSWRQNMPSYEPTFRDGCTRLLPATACWPATCRRQTTLSRWDWP